MRSYYLAKILHKMRLSSFKCCQIDSTAKIDAECALTKVTMGRYSYVGSGTRITDAFIGNFCSIGAHCGIGGGIHPTDMVSTSPAFLKGSNILGKNFAQIPYAASSKVIIGNDVWIGEGVCILSGVKIGDGAVLGAHAVVTHDVEPYTIVAGVPAKEIRKRFSENIITELNQLRWWDWADDKIAKYAGYFNEPLKMIEMVKNDE